MRIIVLLLLQIVVFVGIIFAETQTTAILGFFNKGNSGSEVNTLLTRSFHTFFSRLPGSRVIPIANAERLVQEKKFLNNSVISSEQAIQIGQMLGARIVVTGYYQQNEQKQTIEIEVLALDTATGETRFKRKYQGKAGPALLDTIENVRRSASGMIVGREIGMGTIQLSVTNTTQQYQVFVSGQEEGAAAPVFKKQFPSGVGLDLVLKRKDNQLEVFRTNLSLETGKTFTYRYTPSAVLYIQSAFSPIDLYQDGLKKQVINTREPYLLTGLMADTEYRLALKNKEWQSIVRTIKLREAIPSALSFDTNDFFPKISYTQTEPLLNLLVPSLVQFQAHDTLSGYLFAGLALADLAYLGWSIAGFCVADPIVQNHVDLDYREQVRPYRDFYLGGMIGAGAGWLIIAGASWLHAGLAKQGEEKQAEVSLVLSPELIGVNIKSRF